VSLRTPLGKVLGRGSAKDGTSHWWAQRISAVALAPLTLWFVVELLRMPSLDFGHVHAWLISPLNGFLVLLLLGAMSYHSYLGVSEVIEDYVPSGGVKWVSLLLLRFAHIMIGGAAALAVLRVVFGR
jgi:succinate dehydrogenase / fumarate reductase, membrane anchor subunit